MLKSAVMHASDIDSCCAIAQSFGALPGFPSGSLNDFFAQQPSSSADQTLAHELLGLPTMSQGFSAKVAPLNCIKALCVTCRLLCTGLAWMMCLLQNRAVQRAEQGTCPREHGGECAKHAQSTARAPLDRHVVVWDGLLRIVDSKLCCLGQL